MGDNPCFIPIIFLSFFSRGALFTLYNNSFVSLFIIFVVSSRVLVGVDARFGFLHRNRILLSTVLIAIIRENIIFIWNFLCGISDVYATFVISKFFYLSHGSASKQSSLRTVLFWQILPFHLHSIFYCFLCGFLCSTRFQ